MGIYAQGKGLLRKSQHLLLLAPLESSGQGGKKVAGLRLDLWGSRSCFLRGKTTPGHRRQRENRQMYAGVVGIDGLIDISVDMRIDGAGEAVGDGWNKVAPGRTGAQGVLGVGAYLLRRGVCAVYGCADAAHEHQFAPQVPLESGDVVFRQDPLPDLDADLGHVVHNGRQVGVGVVDGDAPP